jgi:hypothetical protein
MGVTGKEEAVGMCADGQHGGAQALAKCTAQCENVAGAEGLCVPPGPPLPGAHSLVMPRLSSTSSALQGSAAVQEWDMRGSASSVR